jgi:hypothetical protein
METRRHQFWRVHLAIALGCALLPPAGFAQPYAVNPSKIPGGGGTSVDTRYTITGAIGQYDAAPAVSSGGTYSETSGYWNPDSFAAGPIIAPVTNQSVCPGRWLVCKVKASDPNADSLVFSLDPGAPAGAEINPTNGWLVWQPGFAQACSTNAITVRVTETGSPFMSSTATFVVIVEDYLALTLGSTNVIGGQTASLPVTLSSSDGVTNLQFTVQISDAVFTNALIAPTAAGIGSASVTDQGASVLVTIQASPGQVLRGTEPVAELTFTALTNQPSGFVGLPVASVSAAKPDGSGYVNYITQPGWVAMVQDTPLLTAVVGSATDRTLTLYGLMDVNYEVQCATNLVSPIIWLPLLDFTQTNAVITIHVPATNNAIFYRLMCQ